MQSISVIIPVKNGSKTLQRCLVNLTNQLYGIPLEILVLDSGSTDNSVELAKAYGARVLEIDSNHFNHGLTRNIGVKEAKGDLIYFTVQDAWLFVPTNLIEMSKWFEDESVMAVCGHQAVPHEKDKNPLLWFRRVTEPVAEVRQYVSGKDMPSFSWDNVNAMYRKSALIELTFDRTDTAEDCIWAYNALKKGFKLVYDPSLVIYHYHHRTFNYVFRVEFGLYYIFYKNFQFLPRWPGLIIKTCKMIYHISLNNDLSIRERLFWIYHNISSIFSHALTYASFYTLYNIGKEKAVFGLYSKICSSTPQGKQNLK